MFNISLLYEENRFYNWYKGWTLIELPYWGQDLSSGCADSQCAEYRLRYKVQTYAISGNISTQNFGHKFDVDKIKIDCKYGLVVGPPSKHQSNENITLFLNVEKHILQGFDAFYSRLQFALGKSGSTPNPN